MLYGPVDFDGFVLMISSVLVTVKRTRLFTGNLCKNVSKNACTDGISLARSMPTFAKYLLNSFVLCQ